MRACAALLMLLCVCTGARAQTTPFGMTEVPTYLGVVVEKWSAIRQVSSKDGQRPELRAFAQQFNGLVGRQLVAHVNRTVNGLVHPTQDIDQWGVVDHWSPALETLLAKQGDCEDVAILKYAVLRLFLPKDDLRLVVGYDSMRREGHMVLLARAEGLWLTLNNANNTLVEDILVSSKKFRPHYSLTMDGAFQLRDFHAQTRLK